MLSRRTKAELLRFVTNDRHEPFGHRTGIVHKAVELRDSYGIARELSERLADEVDWLNRYMPSPSKFSKSSRVNPDEVAISWVKGSAIEHVGCLRRIQSLLTDAGVPTNCLRTARPGFVVYEDDCQVVALPFSDTPK